MNHDGWTWIAASVSKAIYIYICLCPTQSLDPTCTQCNVLQKVPSWAPCRASAFGPSRTSGNSEIYRIWKSGMWQKSKEIIRKSKSEFVAPRTYVTYEVQREQTFFKAPCMGQVYICIQKCMLAAAALVSKACRLQFIYTCVHLCVSTEQLLWHPERMGHLAWHSARRRCTASKKNCRLGNSI